MAKASITREPVTLELTQQEASVLLQVLECVGGSPDGPRGNIDRICKSLRFVGITRMGKCRGSVHFND
ncbi:hypothetical protein LCGC14_0143190 [marine sediment metagenome]|uniref:Uncharacterized protein n=1 Tax=marine sediment metagenome TaxID=412755 RepID=A0A0F9VGV0_9ZZZZ